MPSLATALKICFSDLGAMPVRSFTSRRKAWSFGMNAVSATVPSVSTLTLLLGLAASTASTA